MLWWLMVLHLARAGCRVAELAKKASLEVSPSSAKHLAGARPRRVFVNMVKRDPAHFEEVAGAVRFLKSEGHEPVPHVPASVLADAADAARTLEALAEAGAKCVLVVGGNSRSRALDALDVATIASPIFETVAFAAFPESPRTDVLASKLSAVPRAAVVTQWCAAPLELRRWVEAFDRDSAELHVGVVGPCEGVEALRSFARVCGVNADAVDDPRALLDEMVAHLAAAEGPLRLHLFPLGGVRQTLAYLRALEEKEE